MMGAAAEGAPDAARFVRLFAEGWAGPSPEKLMDLLDDRIRLVQPIFAPSIGRDAAAARFFRPLLRFMPDVRLEVRRWSASGDVVFIEWTASGTLSGQKLTWSGVDRLILSNGRAVERVAYFDSMPLLVETLRRPSRWLAFWRSGIGRPFRAMFRGASRPVSQ